MINKKFLLIGIKAAISIALVAVVLQGVGLDLAWERLIAAEPGWLLAAAVVIFTQICICSLRWKAVLKGFGAPLKLGLIFRLFYTGAFFNQALPSSMGGDAVRAYRAHRAGLSLGTAVGSVLLDRVATLLALILLVAAAVPFVASSLQGNVALLEWVVLGLLVAALLGTGLLMVLDRIPSRFMEIRAVRHLSAFAGDLRRTFLIPALAAPLLAWSFAGHLALSLVIWLLAGIPLGPGAGLYLNG